MENRPGDATIFGNPLKVSGRKLQPGDQAPDFNLIDFDPKTFAMSPFQLSTLGGKVALLNVVVSLDTPVCHTETKRWEAESKALGGQVELLTISKDLPFAQARWKTAESVNHRTLSAYRDDKFGTDYGVFLTDLGLLQRSVFVIGKDSRLQYAEYVKEQSEEPNYAAALEAARRAAQS